MKLDRTFTTRESIQASLERIARHLENQGYKQRVSAPGLVYERGSGLSTLFAFSAKQWKVLATVQANPGPDQVTNVVATFDISTMGQLVLRRERAYWEKELDGLVASAGGFNADITATAKIEEKLGQEKRLNEGSKWFFWIAGLSIINSIIWFAGGRLNFLIGLGITQLIDGFSIGIAQGSAPDTALVVRLVAFVLDLIIAGIFVLFGIFAKRSQWAFIIGMIIYFLDGLIFLLVPDFLSIGFHLIALFGLYSGLKAFNKIRQSKSILAA